MSKVYKRNEIILSEGKLVDIQISPIIRLNKEKEIDEISIDNMKEIEKNAEVIIKEAKKESEKILQEIQLEYDEILSKAKEEEKNIISEAHTQANGILENAQQEGYVEGLKIGEEKGFEKMNSLIEEAKEIKQRTLEEKKVMAKSLEGEIIDLIITSIKKILSYELEENNALLLNLVEQGIQKCTYTESLIVRVNPNDYEIISSSKNKIYMMTEGISNIEVKEDPGLESNSIIIETESGTVNASMKTQMEHIEKTFYDILKGE